MSATRSHLPETFSGSPLPSLLSDELLPLPTEERRPSGGNLRYACEIARITNYNMNTDGKQNDGLFYYY